MDYTEVPANRGSRRWLLGPTSGHEALVSGLKLLDSVMLTGSFCVAALLTSFRANVDSLEDFLAMRMKIGNFAVFLGMVVLWHVGFRVFRLYRPTGQPFSRDRLRDTFLATTTAVLAVGLCGFVAKNTPRLATRLKLFPRTWRLG